MLDAILTILLVYNGPRDSRLEEDLRRRVGTAFGVVEQVRSHSGEDGMTTLTLALHEADREREATEFLRRQKEVVDAVQDSFGEHA